MKPICLRAFIPCAAVCFFLFRSAHGAADDPNALWLEQFLQSDIDSLLATAPSLVYNELEVFGEAAPESLASSEDYEFVEPDGGFDNDEDRAKFAEALMETVLEQEQDASPQLFPEQQSGADVIAAERPARSLEADAESDKQLRASRTRLRLMGEQRLREKHNIPQHEIENKVETFYWQLARLIYMLNGAISVYESPDGNITQTLNKVHQRYPPWSAEKMNAFLSQNPLASYMSSRLRSVCSQADEKTAGNDRIPTAFPRCLIDDLQNNTKRHAVERDLLVGTVLNGKKVAAFLDQENGFCAPVAYLLGLPASFCTELLELYVSLPELFFAVNRPRTWAGWQFIPTHHRYHKMPFKEGINLAGEFTEVDEAETERARDLNKRVFSTSWKHISVFQLRAGERLLSDGMTDTWSSCIHPFRWLSYMGLLLLSDPPVLAQAV